MKQILLFLSLLLPFCTFSQLQEDFSGISVSSNNTWQGNTNMFTVNESQQLQFVSPKGRAGEASLFAPITLTENMTWETDVQLAFKPSNSNNLRIQVFTSEYIKVYIQAGSNNGEVSLYMDNGGKSPVRLIKGREKLLSEEPYPYISIRLTLEDGAYWTLYTCRSDEEDFVKEGSKEIYIDDMEGANQFLLNFRYVQARSSTYYVDNIRVINNNPSSVPDPDKPSDVDLINIEQLSANELLFYFDQPVDISDAVCKIEGMGKASEIAYGRTESIVYIRLPEALKEENVYLITLENLYDTEGRLMEDITLELYFEDEEKPEESDGPEVEPGELIFNELLPNPHPGGSEYIELFNRSDHAISLSGLAISIRKADGSLNMAYPLSAISTPIEKGSFVLLTKDIEGVTGWYSILHPNTLYELKIPVLANTSSTLVLYRMKDGLIIDEINYSSKWHATSVTNQKGVALERIDPDGKTQDANNWTSATFQSGYGTPGYENSQNRNNEKEGEEEISVPVANEDGSYTVKYVLNASGYSCRAFIYTVNGYKIAEIANNEALGQRGELRWNGQSLNGSKLHTGIYIFSIELFNREGTKKHTKKIFLVR